MKPIRNCNRGNRGVWVVALVFLGVSLSFDAQAQQRPLPPTKRPPAKVGPSSSVPPARYKGIWEPVSYPEDLKLFDVFFVNADVGWVAGGTNEMQGGIILNTRDGGDSWTVQYGDPESSERALKDLRFTDETNGWAVQLTSSDAKLLHTRDGENWILAGTMTEHYVDYMFTSEKTGVFLGSQGEVFVTQDGGRKWQQVFKCAAKIQVEGLWRNVACHWKRLQFLTPSTGYAVARSSAAKGIFLARTGDGGATWSLTYSEVPGHAEDAFFLNENTGYVRVGYADTGQLYKTEDGGQTWTGMAASPGRRILFADPEVGWAIHYNKVSFTTNAGLRWNSREYRFPATTWAFSLPRRDRGYVVGEHGMIYRYRIVSEDYTARGMMPAPLLSGIDSPLDEQVTQLQQQLQSLEQAIETKTGQQLDITGATDASQPGEATPPPAEAEATAAEGPGLAEQVAAGQLTAIESTVENISAEVPKFSGKYRNLNLIFSGLQMVGQLFGQAQGMKDAFKQLRSARDLGSVSAALNQLTSQTQTMVQSAKSAFQAPSQ